MRVSLHFPYDREASQYCCSYATQPYQLATASTRIRRRVVVARQLVATSGKCRQLRATFIYETEAGVEPRSPVYRRQFSCRIRRDVSCPHFLGAAIGSNSGEDQTKPSGVLWKPNGLAAFRVDRCPCHPPRSLLPSTRPWPSKKSPQAERLMPPRSWMQTYGLSSDAHCTTLRLGLV